MRKSPILTLSALFLGAIVLMGDGCPFIPDVEEKLIELAVGSSTTMEFQARGSINVYEEDFDLEGGLDIEELLDDAGIGVQDVLDIALSGISHRVTLPQAGRTIQNGNVTIKRDGGTEKTLITSFSADADAVTDFITAELDTAGVSLINTMLKDLLLEVQGGPDAILTGTATVTGLSDPPDEETFFDWELKVDVTIVGTIKMDVVDF